MRIHRLRMVVLVASLAGCYAQVEDSAVQVAHSLCNPSTSPCIPGGPNVPITAFKAAGSSTFTVNFGAVPLLKSSIAVGPATAHGTLALNDAMFVMRTAGASFSGIQTVQLLKAPAASSPTNPDPCGAPTANCPVIASYDSTVDPPADQQIVLRSQVQNLLDLIDPAQHNLIIEVSATGFAPTRNWSADLVMDLGMKARLKYP